MASLVVKLVFRSVSGIGFLRTLEGPPTTAEEDVEDAPLRALPDSRVVCVEVGPGPSHFYAAEALLAARSSAFRTSLRSRGNAMPSIILEDVSYAIYSTFNAWMYGRGLDTLHARFTDVGEYETHLVQLYAFAQKYGIAGMLGHITTLFERQETAITLPALMEAVNTVHHQSSLYRVLVKCEAGTKVQRSEDEVNQIPAYFFYEALRIARTTHATDHTDT